MSDPSSNQQPGSPAGDVSLADFQALIREMYFSKDEARGVDGTFMWLMEEVGELAAALREGSADDKNEEFADVLAWLTTIANISGPARRRAQALTTIPAQMTLQLTRSHVC